MSGWSLTGARLRACGRALDYRCWGPGPEDAPSLLLLHEGLGSLGLWKGFPEALTRATGWGVAAFSRAGYGASEPCDLPRPLDYMTREAVEVLPQVINALGLRRCVTLGHSDGATIAAIHAGSVPDDRLRGLVLIAPHFFTEPEGLAEIARAREAYETGDLKARLARHHADPDCAFRGWNDAWLDPGFRAWDVSGVLDTIRVPVLAVQGDADPYGSMAQIRVVEARCPAPVEVAVLPECGHAPHLERGPGLLAAVAAFLAQPALVEAAG